MPGQRLTLEEREIISRGLAAEQSYREIAGEPYVQRRGALREELTDALRTGRARRRPKGPNPDRGRETAENTNRLLRQYLPRKLDFSTLSQEELDRIAAELNRRPRETPGWKTPAERFSEFVETTG